MFAGYHPMSAGYHPMQAARAEGLFLFRAGPGVETSEDGKENAFRVTSREGFACEGKKTLKNPSAENTRSRLSAAFEGKARRDF